MSDLIKLKAER